MADRWADDADVIKANIDRLAYERAMAQVMADCAVLTGGAKPDCVQCKGVRCLLCKTYQSGNVDGAKGCLLCTKPDGTYHPCPPSA